MLGDCFEIWEKMLLNFMCLASNIWVFGTRSCVPGTTCVCAWLSMWPLYPLVAAGCSFMQARCNPVASPLQIPQGYWGGHVERVSPANSGVSEPILALSGKYDIDLSRIDDLDPHPELEKHPMSLEASQSSRESVSYTHLTLPTKA